MSEYHVACVRKAEEQIRDIEAHLLSSEERQGLQATLIAIYKNLAAQPQDWGDPLRHTKKHGGMVYRGMLSNMVVHYAVLEVERVVFVLDFRIYEKNGP